MRKVKEDEIEIITEQVDNGDGLRYYPENGLLTIYGDIVENTGKSLLDIAVREHRNIKFVALDTNGGNSTTSLLIGEVIKALKIPVMGLGRVYSAGSYIYSFGTKRYCLDTTGFLVHSGVVSLGTSPYNDIKEFWPYWERVSEKYLNQILSCTKLASSQRKTLGEAILSGKEYYFDALESKKMGLTHEIIDFSSFMKLLETKSKK